LAQSACRLELACPTLCLSRGTSATIRGNLGVAASFAPSHVARHPANMVAMLGCYDTDISQAFAETLLHLPLSIKSDACPSLPTLFYLKFLSSIFCGGV
jgi:hypothetical protein